MKDFNKKDKQNIIIVNIIVALILILFFTKSCPIVPYDADDWIHLGQMRIPLPIWNGWNPSKVLPEVLMPMCGYVGAYVIYPFVGDYLFSITIAAAIILVLHIIVLCICFMMFVHKRLGFSVNLSLAFEILFLIFCFAIFRNRGTSRYMFYADNMNCIFNYTVPGIVNAISVLFMMSYQDFSKAYKNFGTVKKSLFILLIYFSVFSNIFHSETIAIYCGLILLNELIRKIKNKELVLREYIKQNKIYLSILMAWLCALVFELSGGRAGVVSIGKSLDFETSIRQLYAMIQAMADPFFVAFLMALIWLLFGVITKRKAPNLMCNMYESVIFNAGVLAVYLVLLSAIVPYLSRIEASWNLWFYVVVVTVIGIASFVSAFSKVKVLLIPVIFVSLVAAFYPDGRFLMSTLGNTDYATCVNTGNYVIEQIVDADCDGKMSVEIEVPVYPDKNYEWAFSNTFGAEVANTLYNHNIIRHKIDVTTILNSKLTYEMKAIIKE